jgi:two-component system sensor histidine kinase UhpB
VKEQERQKLAEHLHDEFGQDLVVAKMKLRLLSNSLPAAYEAEIKGLTDLLDRLIHRTRVAIHELSAQLLSQGGLKAALRALAEELQQSHGLVCVAETDQIPALNNELQQVIFQAVRELVFNAVKHAAASKISIHVTCTPDSIAVEVSDDGRGFVQSRPSLSGLSIGRFGLFNVRARLAVHGGSLQIISRRAKGTRAVITLSLDTPTGV